MRCVYLNRDCGPLHPPTLSAPTQRFQLANFFDSDAPARPIRITLPTRHDAGRPAQAQQEHRLRHLRRAVRPDPARQGARARRPGALGAAVAAAQGSRRRRRRRLSQDGGGINIGMICSLSIPIITICALILLIIIVTLLDFIFRWLPFFLLCFPVPGLKGKRMSDRDSIFGRSLSFPLRVGGDGRLVWSEGEDNIRESIAVILKTEPGERIVLPDFGAGLGRFLFEPNNAATHARIEDAITTALARWEPRIDVEAVDVVPDAVGAVRRARHHHLPAGRDRRARAHQRFRARWAPYDRVDRHAARTARHRRPPLPATGGRDAGARAGPHAGMDQLQPQRSRRHAGAAVRLPHGEPCFIAPTRFPSATASSFCSCSACRSRRRARREDLSPSTTNAGPRPHRRSQSDLEVRAGAVSFPHRVAGSTSCRSRRASSSSDRWPRRRRTCVDYYRLLYASYQTQMPVNPQLYETVALRSRRSSIRWTSSNDTVDRSLWIALLGRADAAGPDPNDPWKPVRDESAGRTLTLGLVPALDAVQTRARARRPGAAERSPRLRDAATGGRRHDRRATLTGGRRRATASSSRAPTSTCSRRRASCSLPCPRPTSIGMWSDLDPLEGGVGDLPPTLDDAALADRLITWLRVRATGAARARIAVGRHQRRARAPTRAHDRRAAGRRRRHARPDAPAVARAGAGRIRSRSSRRSTRPGAALERDRRPGGGRAGSAGDRTRGFRPARPPPPRAPTEVFVADHEAGTLTFGDGLRGRRLPLGARVFASYEFCQGAAGNVATRRDQQRAAAALRLHGRQSGAHLGRGGCGDASSTARSRSSAFCSIAIAWSASAISRRSPGARPGVDVGRIEVLPPSIRTCSPNEPGAAPGVVTVMAIPQFDPVSRTRRVPTGCSSTRLCRYLDPRRLVTTELIVRGPIYKGTLDLRRRRRRGRLCRGRGGRRA